MRRPTRYLIAIFLLAVAARASEPVAFVEEPERGLTFSHSGELEAGSEIWLEVADLPRDQRFVASRCGESCDTSVQVFALAGQGLPLMNRSFGVEETARYYFFVQRRDESGATGPMPITSFRPLEEGFEAMFEGGATVRGYLRQGTGTTPAAEPERSEGDSIEILAVTPPSLTRGVPTEIMIDVRVSLDSVSEADVGLGFNQEEPGRFDWVDSRVVAPGTQQLTFITEVIPVDWGDRGQFSASVFLLPVREGSGRIRTLANDKLALEVVP